MEDFVIPVSREDLLKRTSFNQYVVDDITPTRMIKQAIADCRRQLREEGYTYLWNAFPVFFSVLHQFQDLEISVKENAFELIVNTCKAGLKQISELLDSNGDHDEQVKLRNVVKMSSYLLCQFLELFESDLNQGSTSVISKGRGKKKKNPVAIKMTLDWPVECEFAIQSFNQLFKLPIHHLWDPPVVEEDFVNLLSNACYKLLENPEMSKQVGLRAAITSLLGSLCRRHNHSVDCCMKLTQLLHCFPHFANCLLAMTKSLIEEENLKSLIADLLKELCSYSGSDLERDSQAAHSISQYLTEISSAYPHLAQAVLPHLKTKLDEDPYTMRNCALGVIGEVVINIYSNNEQLDPNHRKQKDKLLDVLEEHIHDCNGFVRSKVLSIWLNIVSSGVLPVRRQSRLLSLLIGPQGAILDTSNMARKNALKIVTVMVTKNPAGELPHDKLKESYETEAKTLENMKENQDPAVVELERKWNLILKPFQKALMEGALTDEFEIQIGDVDTPDSVSKTIHDLLHSGEYRQAIQFFTMAQESFPDSVVFNDIARQPDEQPEGTDEELIRRKLQLWLFKLQNIFMEAANDPEPDTQGGTQDVLRQTALVDYLREMVTLSSQIQNALPDVRQMLLSKTNSDVIEAVDFFVNGKLAGVAHMDSGVRKMLVLVWSKEPTVKEAIVTAYRRIYMQPEENVSGGKASFIVTSLSSLLTNATLGEVLSLEQLIMEFYNSGDIEPPFVQELWDRLAKRVAGTSHQDRKNAIILLGMIASASSETVKSNIDLLVSEGLTLGNPPDLRMVMYACSVLQKIVLKPKSSDKKEEPFRLPREHAMFTRIAKILATTFPLKSDRYWIPMMEQIVNTIYGLSEQPDVTCGDLLRQLTNNLIQEDKENLTAPPPPVAETEAATPDNESVFLTGTSQVNRQLMCPMYLLSRFLAMIGHVALKQLVHLDVSVLNELKRRRTLKEEKEEKKIRQKKTVRPSAADRSDTNSTNVNEEDMGLTGATADDMEAEMMRRLCDTEIVTGSQNMLARLAPLVVHVCSNTTRYSHPDVQAAASLALSKMMLVSSEFCEKNLQLLFTLAERSQTEVIRANLIVALGDLTKRFPNLIEPWTPHLYARLRDESSKVRLNAINTLSHLILNDMIKVKGNISEMTTCLVDQSERIIHLSKLFFHELAQKGNALYNIMPDIISRLSDAENGIDEANFRIIMEYLFPYIIKERLCETLVDKLCVRFRATQVERQWRDLAYCLELMAYNDKMIRKLQENLPTYVDKLHVEEVYAAFTNIVANARKVIKGEQMVLVDELESKIEEYHKKGVADEEAVQNAEKAAAAARQKNRLSKRRSRGARNSSQDQPTLSQQQDGEHATQAEGGGGAESSPEHHHRPSPKKRGRREPRSEEDDEQPGPSRKPRRKSSAVLYFSSDEED